MLVVMGVASVGMHMVDKHSEQAVLESQVDTYHSIAHWVLLIVFVLAQLVVESARAAFIADTGLRSATRALGRGFRQVFRRPLWTVVFYLVVTLVGLLIAAAFSMARIHVTAFGALRVSVRPRAEPAYRPCDWLDAYGASVCTGRRSAVCRARQAASGISINVNA
jgi:hypothetical protein